MAGVRVEGACAQPDAARLHPHGAQVGDGIAFEIAVVHPDGIDAELLRAARPRRDLPDFASGGQPDSDPAPKLCHEITVLHGRIGRNRHPA